MSNRPASRWTAALTVAVGLAAVLAASNGVPVVASQGSPLRIEVSFPASLEAKPLDGRVLVIISKDQAREPRMQVGRGLQSQPLFGVDVDSLAPGTPAIVDAATRGWPVES